MDLSWNSVSSLASELEMQTLVAHCHLGLGKLYRRSGTSKQAHEHLAAATTMYRGHAVLSRAGRGGDEGVGLRVTLRLLLAIQEVMTLLRA